MGLFHGVAGLQTGTFGQPDRSRFSGNPPETPQNPPTKITLRNHPTNTPARYTPNRQARPLLEQPVFALLAPMVCHTLVG